MVPPLLNPGSTGVVVSVATPLVRYLWQYWEWLERQVIETGGELSNRSYIEPTAFYESDDPDDDELRLLEVRNHLILFPSQGVFVDATLVVTPTWSRRSTSTTMQSSADG